MSENEVYLSVIIPAYNEEKRLPKTLDMVANYLKKQNYSFEIIVVNDGSKDNTAGVVREKMKEIVNLFLIDNKENHGKGYVTRQGMMSAKGKYRLFTDADNSTSIEHVEKVFPWFEEGYDVVIGSRDIEGAILDPPQPLYRRLLGKLFRLMVHLVVDLWEIKDTQCGFKAFKKEVVEAVFPFCLINRFAFDPEMLILAKKKGFKIKEIPVRWKNDPHSKVKFKNMIKMGIDLLKIRWYLMTKKYERKKE